MKLERRYLAKCYHDAMILQYKDMLISQGFSVVLEKRLQVGALRLEADLYASKEGEIRIYEFKLIGNKKHQKESIAKFKEIAEKIGAKPIVVYVNPPSEKNIEIEDLASALYSYIDMNGNPSVLDEMYTHTGIEDVEIEDVTNVYISPDSIKVEGDAIIHVYLQYGSDMDGGPDLSTSFPMTFKAELDFDLSVTDMEYSIDVSDWYSE